MKITEEDFYLSCNSGRCLRNTMKSKNCLKSYKQEGCWKKYGKQDEKNKDKRNSTISENKNKEVEIDQEWIATKNAVWQKYYGENAPAGQVSDWKQYCMLWNSLRKAEQDSVIKTQYSDLYLNKHIDPAHIEQKGSVPELKYDVENVILIGRLFHRLLDDFKDPVTKKNITAEQRTAWMIRAKNGY